MERCAAQLPPAELELARRYRRLTPVDVDIGFAGRFAASHSIHSDIAKLEARHAIELKQRGHRWELYDTHGALVGRLARSFRAPDNLQCISATVIAILTRRRDETAPEYREGLRVDAWEVVLPELVFMPLDTKILLND